MKVLIVDLRDPRRDALADVVRQVTSEVLAVPGASELSPWPPADIVFVHAGVDQGAIGPLIAHYNRSSWVICYAGGLAFDNAVNDPRASVAFFPGRVSGYEPGDDLTRVVQKVLRDWPQRQSLPGNRLRELVHGFDEQLEVKLDVLCTYMAGQTPDQERMADFMRCCPFAFDNGKLRVDCASPNWLTRLRRLLFTD